MRLWKRHHHEHVAPWRDRIFMIWDIIKGCDVSMRYFAHISTREAIRVAIESARAERQAQHHRDQAPLN